MILEFCAENSEKIPHAIKAGAKRIELCDRLDLGGVTPSRAVQIEALEHSHRHNVSVMGMIRPRGGNFIYSETEIDIMAERVKESVSLGMDGIVFGCLTEEGLLDTLNIERLLSLAKGKETVFHMAFDFISKDKQQSALETLIDYGMTRVLTRGGVSGSALDNKEHVNKIINWSEGRIEILPGGGITSDNLDECKKAIHSNQFHGTSVVPL